MFLKTLSIKQGSGAIREINFHKGLNLIVDETETSDTLGALSAEQQNQPPEALVISNRQRTGNNVGKTTVLRLIDYALGSKGENIYKDIEFRSSNAKVKQFLQDNNVIIELILKKDINLPKSKEIRIERNFLQRKEKIQKIDGEAYNSNVDFTRKLLTIFFASDVKKPSFREIISKNIRDEKNKLSNLARVLHDTTTRDEYEALYLFWFGIRIADLQEKQKLTKQKKQEETLKQRLEKEEGSLLAIKESLRILNKEIIETEKHREKRLEFNEHYQKDIDA